MNVQLIGMFNSGTNLVARIIKHFFDCTIHTEGHTLFWKHSIVSKKVMQQIFAKPKHTQTTVFVLVIKRYDWWVESMSKSKYNIEFEKDGSITVKPPKHTHTHSFNFLAPTQPDTFPNMQEYYNTFHEQALQNIPGLRLITLRYQDVLLHPKDVLTRISKKIPFQQKFIKSPLTISRDLKEIFEKPAKKTGNSRYGQNAKLHYSRLLQEKNNQHFVESNEMLSQNIKKIYST